MGRYTNIRTFLPFYLYIFTENCVYIRRIYQFLSAQYFYSVACYHWLLHSTHAVFELVRISCLTLRSLIYLFIVSVSTLSFTVLALRFVRKLEWRRHEVILQRAGLKLVLWVFHRRPKHSFEAAAKKWRNGVNIKRLKYQNICFMH